MFRGWHRDIPLFKHILRSAEEIEPSMRFKGETLEDFHAWENEFGAKFSELLGPFPPQVPLNPRVVAKVEREDHVVEKFIIDVEKHLSAPGYLLTPKNLKEGEKRPAVLVCHGHCSPNGKADVSGLGDKTRESDLHALMMVRQGYVTAVIDVRGFAERALPITTKDAESRCNYLFMLYAALGYNLVTLCVHDQKRAIDYLLSRPEVDGDRLGVFGRSFGGTQAMYVGVCDERIKAIAISCYMSTNLEYTFEDFNNNCGVQIVPGLYRYGDVGTVGGLLAPRPTLIQSGFADSCFSIDSATPGHEEMRTIFKAAGVENKLTIDIFPGKHDVNPPVVYEFFKRWL